MPVRDNAELWERTTLVISEERTTLPRLNRRLIARGASVRGRRVGLRVAEGSEAGLIAGDRGEGIQEVTSRRGIQFEPRHRQHVTRVPIRRASAVHCTKNLLEIRTAPSRVPARKSFALVQKSGATPSDSAGEEFGYAFAG